MEQNISEPNYYFECEWCDDKTIFLHALKGHTDFEHTSNLWHTSEWEFNNPIINEHSFSEDIDICFQCDESTDVC